MLDKYSDKSCSESITEYYRRLFFINIDNIIKNHISEKYDSIQLIKFKEYAERFETKNLFLLSLGKEYDSNFIFCLDGYLDMLLDEGPQIKEKWEHIYSEMSESSGNINVQCVVSGNRESIAKIHNKVKGIYGGNATGSVFIGFNFPSVCLYGNEQSYNSNISARAMKKYTEDFNYLLKSPKHKTSIDDITVVFWTEDKKDNDKYSELMSRLTNYNSGGMDKKQTNAIMTDLIKSAHLGTITPKQVENIGDIDFNADFYIVWVRVKPKSSRVVLKFIYHKKLG